MSSVVSISDVLKGRVLLLNAPKGAGKDYLGHYLSKLTLATTHSFKQHLYECTDKLFCLPAGTTQVRNNARDTKELCYEDYTVMTDAAIAMCVRCNLDVSEFVPDPLAQATQLSPRGALIYTSEMIYKPTFGSDYFGHKLAEQLDLVYGAVVTDSGFPEEVYPLIDKVGEGNVFIVKFSRDGCSYGGGDSRNYLPEIPGTNEIFLENNGTREEFCGKVILWLKTFD